ncbi:hypothetical protein BH23GEM4_BH23GEM4_16190 [soil metagenome]
MLHPKLTRPLIPLALLALAACADHRDKAGEQAAAAPEANASATPPTITVRTRDFTFDTPDTLPAGATTIRLINDGPELHHVTLMRLGEHSLGDLVGFIQTEHKIPPWVVEVGGPNAPAPGEETNATLNLQPGRYAMVCLIPSGDGIPHVMKGMAREIVVAPRGATLAESPDPDIEMKLTDYDFEMPELTTGKQTIRVVNDAKQAHEAVIVRLGPGKTAMDFLAWVEKQEGPPPAKPLGGVTDMSPGESNLITVDLPPGKYALLCFTADAGDGRPHFMHGMVKEFTVRGAAT